MFSVLPTGRGSRERSQVLIRMHLKEKRAELEEEEVGGCEAGWKGEVGGRGAKGTLGRPLAPEAYLNHAISRAPSPRLLAASSGSPFGA